jgi:hypothetical protein
MRQGGGNQPLGEAAGLPVNQVSGSMLQYMREHLVWQVVKDGHPR